MHIDERTHIDTLKMQLCAVNAHFYRAKGIMVSLLLEILKRKFIENSENLCYKHKYKRMHTHTHSTHLKSLISFRQTHKMQAHTLCVVCTTYNVHIQSVFIFYLRPSFSKLLGSADQFINHICTKWKCGTMLAEVAVAL